MKRRTSWKVIGGITAGVLVLCCGGFLGLGALVDEPADKKTAAGLGATLPAENPSESGSAAEPEPTRESPATSSSPASKPAKTAKSPRPSTTKGRPSTVKPTTVKPTTVKPTTRKPKKTKSPTPKLRTVTPGAFCSPVGAMGVSKTGKVYRCTRKAGEDRARWRQP